MNVLFVASECAPFVKTGGLADVIGAVPKALMAQGLQVRVLLPAYPALAAQVAAGRTVWEADDLYGGSARVVAVSAQGLDLLLLDAPHLFDRPGNIYLDANNVDWSDNHLRFGALSRVAAHLAVEGIDGWTPDLVNAHDWQAALVPAFLTQLAVDIPTVITIHNIAFQGLFDPSVVAQLGLPADMFTFDRGEFFGRFSFLKCGLSMAAKISTVSPTYANELMDHEYGMGLEGLLQARRNDLTGIVNGIDLDIWNPADDAAIPMSYSVKTLKRKAQNRATLEHRFGLQANTDAPLFCVISRLTSQKGLDLLLECLPGLVGRGARLALVGTGDKHLERAYVAAAQEYAGHVGVIIGYDEDLSHLMQAGADAILIPSRFEPCGLTQLYGLRYGTVPVVARTGGLADTVIDANLAAIDAGCATGIQFAPVTAMALDQAIGRTCDLFADGLFWAGMMRRGMRQPVGWDASAGAYLRLYQSVMSE